VTEPARSDAPRVHPTALIESGVQIGPRSALWDNVHVRAPATIGRDCIVGEKTYVAYGVRIGDCVKINAMVYVCTGVTIEDRVFVGAGTIFTNDRYPRAFADGVDGLAPSEPNDDTLATFVRTGATIGAGATIGPGLEIGRYAMVGMAAVVTGDVPPHGLALGAPARLRGYVCVCGTPLRGIAVGAEAATPEARCTRCERRFGFAGGVLMPHD
jgi:UDP-2-acetamido-3-amino-2,3-dideoxy-glucuronate N-acetyltransferase